MKGALGAIHILFLMMSAPPIPTTYSALISRNCSRTLSLCTQDSPKDTTPNNCIFVDGDTSYSCKPISYYISLGCTQVQINALDCLEVEIYPGTYTFTQDASMLNYSVVVSAPQGGVSILCGSECPNVTDASSARLLWFQRETTASRFLSIEIDEFFVQLDGISFSGCNNPLQFDAVDYVGISNCSFSGFTASAVDIFNCQRVQVEFSNFHNCTAMSEKAQFRSNSGGLSIAFHTNDTVYFNSSLDPRVQVIGCVFTQNQVQLPRDNAQQQINQALNNHYFLGRGGGLGISLDEYFIDISVTVDSCHFEKNFAESYGGGLYLYLDGSGTQHNFTVRNCNFTNNSAGNNSFGGGLQVALLIRNGIKPSRLYFHQCHFFRNTASFGGGMSTVQVYSQGAGNIVSLTESTFEENYASDVGSAVMFASLLYVQNRDPSHHYQVKDNVFFNNTSPGGVFGAGFVHQDFSGHNSFLNNTGPGLRVVGSLIKVEGLLSFVGNNAVDFEGGALYVSAFGQVTLYRGAELFFTENVGRIGAAIVVKVQLSSRPFSKVIFNPQCFLSFEDTETAPDEWDNVTIHFSGNRAQVAPVVYISHLDLCSWFSVTEALIGSNLIEATFSIANFTRWPVFDYSPNNLALSQATPSAEKYYIQTEAQFLSSQTATEVLKAVHPGQALKLNVVGLDQFHNPTYFIARVSDSRADVNSGAFSQATDTDIDITVNADAAVLFEPALIPIQPSDKVLMVEYLVPDSSTDIQPGSSIIAVVDTPYNVRDAMHFEFLFNYSSCFAGYKLSLRAGHSFSTCTCLDETFSIQACDSRNRIIVLKDGLWASSSGGLSPDLDVHTCPAPYCQCKENNITCNNLYYQEDPEHNRQCHPLRSGTLCGRCVNGTGVGVLRFNCRDCSTKNYWTLGFLVICDVLVCGSILFALVKLHGTFPHSMKGFLFYIQTLYYSTAYFPTSFWDARQYMLYLSSALGLYFPWDFCLFPGMSALASFPPRFIPPIIATSVSIAALLFVFFKKRAKKRIWHGLWAFVLLLYTPLVYTSIALLHCTALPSAEGGSTVLRWYLDGEVVCFRNAGHLALGLVAIITLTALVLILPVLFIVALVGNNPKVQAYPLAERVYEAISAGYHERARWWGVWDLTRRLLIIVVVVTLPGRTVAGLYIIISALALHLFFLPYLKWWQNLLEVLLLSNYTLLLLFRSTQSILGDLSFYYGTTVPESRGSGLAEVDGLTVFFSFWYYLPLVVGLVISLSAGIRTIVIHSKRMGSRSQAIDIEFEVLDVYNTPSEDVTHTDVTIN